MPTLPLVLTLTAAVPAADAVPEGRNYHKVEQNNGNCFISNTAESEKCLNRRTLCRPGNFPPHLHITTVHTVPSRKVHFQKKAIRPTRIVHCTVNHGAKLGEGNCSRFPSKNRLHACMHACAESKPPQASTTIWRPERVCEDHTIDTPQKMLSRSGSTEQFFSSFHKLTSFIFRNRNERVLCQLHTNPTLSHLA